MTSHNQLTSSFFLLLFFFIFVFTFFFFIIFCVCVCVQIYRNTQNDNHNHWSFHLLAIVTQVLIAKSICKSWFNDNTNLLNVDLRKKIPFFFFSSFLVDWLLSTVLSSSFFFSPFFFSCYILTARCNRAEENE